MFDLRPLRIPGCVELTPVKRSDNRGFFVKSFHWTFFAEHGLSGDFKEQYYSMSTQGCLRGMHFQTPPHDHEKLVYCVAGSVLDVVVDLRGGSPTYGQADSVVLSSEHCNQLYIPRGLAHGFYVLSPQATMIYNVTSEYAPACDAGIHWKSVPFAWTDHDPILSERDQAFPMLQDFVSPFK